MRNFAEEPPAARRLKDVVGRHGDIPEQVTRSYVRHLVYVFLTNGYGVAWNAEPIYRELIGRFDGHQAAIALRSFTHSHIRLRLQDDLPRKKWKELLDLIDPKLTGRGDRAFLDTVRTFRGTPDRLYQDTKIKALTKTWLERNQT